MVMFSSSKEKVRALSLSLFLSLTPNRVNLHKAKFQY